MGLMDIGNNNPYAIINPFAAVIDSARKGWNENEARISERNKDALAQQQQAMLMKMKQDEADRLTKQAEAEAVAKGQLQERMLGKQVSIPASQMRPQGLLGDIMAQSPVPQEPFMYRDEKTASPMNQQELLNFSLANSGTQAGKDTLEQAKMMIKDKTPQQAWAEKVLGSPKDFDDKSISLANMIMGVDGGGVIRAEKPAYKQRQYEKGNEIIHEYSNDDGKSWLPLSKAPRYKPASGDGGRKYEFKDVMGLRKEFSALPEVKDYVTIDSQARRARAALAESLKSGSNNTPVDQTVITAFNKILDPTSVVRESEYARTPQDMAVLNRLKGSMEKIAKGGAGLDRETRAAMLRMVENFHNVSSEQYRATVENYSEIARRNGFDPRDVIKFGHSRRDEPVSNPTMNSLPDATQHKGRVVLGSDGIKRVSDGSKWVIKR